MPIDRICGELIDFKNERGWGEHHTPQALARALMVEVGELNELFLWDSEPDNNKLADEIADCMIYCLNMCIVSGFDPEQIILDKIKKNAIKYPVDSAKRW